tara:strand:- start:317 stop:1039 length:723 start_codon:yes stop_codon:yes gene_type:complete
VLFVDDRENPKVSNQVLMALGDNSLNESGQARLERLPVGDYTIPDMGWGMEAKEINDLYNSIMGHGRSRTVHAQLVDLADNFDVAFLVVYGTQLKPFVRGRKPTRKEIAIQIQRMELTIKKFKETLHIRHPKIKFMQVDTMKDFVEWVKTNYTQMIIQGKRNNNPFLSGGVMAETDPRVRMLCGVQGVTPKIARDLLERHNSLSKILDKKMTQKELMKTNGVTRQRARLLKAASNLWLEE